MGTPSGIEAEVYTTAVAPPFATDVLAEEIAAAVKSACQKRGRLSLVRDGRLDRAAYDIARETGGQKAPASDAVSFLLWHYGVAEPEPNLFLARGDDGAEAAGVASLQAQWERAADFSAWRRVGVGVVRTDRKWSAAVIFQEKNLDLEPVPRRLGAKGRTLVAGRLRAAFAHPEILVTPPRGAVERLAVVAKGDGLSTWFECKSGAGAYQVEISAQDEHGPRVLANFPVYCGVDPPQAFARAADAPRTFADAAEAEDMIFDLVNRDRQGSGLPALLRDPRLAAVARRYSQEMAATGAVVHISRRSGSVIERVAAAGIVPPPTTLAENVGRSNSPADVERGFMSSPGHRDNILGRGITHLGVGVALGRDEGGEVTLFVTQIFAGFRP